MCQRIDRETEVSLDVESMAFANVRMHRAIDAQRALADLLRRANDPCSLATIAEMVDGMTDRIEAAFRSFEDCCLALQAKADVPHDCVTPQGGGNVLLWGQAMSGCQQMLTTEQRDALEWLANGETGVSSKTLVFRVMFDIRLHDGSHPYDLADLNRCIKALNAIPAMRPNLHKMADMSLTWKRLVSSWGVLEKSFVNEAGIDWVKSRQAPITHDLIQRVFAGEFLADSPSGQPGNAC